MRASYARHRDILKLVGSPTPERRWVLKYPAHLRHLQAVFGNLPGRVHRSDPPGPRARPPVALQPHCRLARAVRGQSPTGSGSPSGSWASGPGRWRTGSRSAASGGREAVLRPVLPEKIRVADPGERDPAHLRALSGWSSATRRSGACAPGTSEPAGKHAEHRATRPEEFGLTEAKMAERLPRTRSSSRSRRSGSPETPRRRRFVMLSRRRPRPGRSRVLELSDESGAYCGKLFADMGADVIKIEPRAGRSDAQTCPRSGRTCPAPSVACSSCT